jgi:prefoldin subunit 4
MMGSGDKVMLMMGETFFEASEEDVTEYCEEEVEKKQAQVDELAQEEVDILEQQATLKKILYGRFGKSIQLEQD